MIDAVKSYLQMASGLVEASAAKAMEAAQGLVSSGLESGTKAPEQMATQVATIAEDLLAQSRTNRELLVGLVRTEVERAVGRIGFVREEELAAVRAHVDRLEREINERLSQVGDLPGVSSTVDAVAGFADSAAGEAMAAAESAAESAAAVARSARTLAGTTATRRLGLQHSEPEEKAVPAKKVVVKKAAPAKKTVAAPAPAKKTAAKKAATKKAPAKKAPAKTAATKKAPAKRTTAKKAAPKATSADKE
ncbi:MAG TPA: hypothetical protein PLB21_00030 [Actinomycetota bacterium]|nr:hypothetical protein [Actinomycetota bacterium]